MDKKRLVSCTKNVDIIFHFAGMADIDQANKFPADSLNLNINGTINVLEACVKNKVKKLIFASSIYALSEQGGFYSKSKLSSEMIIEQYSKKYKFDFIVLRFGSLYGGKANKFNSIGKYIEQAINSKKIVRFSDGEEVRNYIFIEDAMEICANLVKAEFRNQHLNLFGKKKVKVKKVLKLVKNIFNAKELLFKNKNYEYHYKVNPYTLKIKKGKNLYPKREANLREALKKINNEYKKN